MKQRYPLTAPKEIHRLLMSEGEELDALLTEALRLRRAHTGEAVYLRGLIEYSNRCAKDCLYCGIRRSAAGVVRYTLSHEEVVEAAGVAHAAGWASIVLQAGERQDEAHVASIEELLHTIHERFKGALGITLSLGEQSEATYERWHKAGARRYLLRIESSSPELYASLHPTDPLHRFEQRVEALHALRRTGYQVGTGVMIGLPGQRIEHLVADLQWMQRFGIDMCGMGPYIPASGTPLSERSGEIPTESERLALSLKMIATLRLMMPSINIAASTALQSLDPTALKRALLGGANIVMPRLTPSSERSHYQLYDRPTPPRSQQELLTEIAAASPLGLNAWGDSPHFKERKSKRAVK